MEFSPKQTSTNLFSVVWLSLNTVAAKPYTFKELTYSMMMMCSNSDTAASTRYASNSECHAYVIATNGKLRQVISKEFYFCTMTKCVALLMIIIPHQVWGLLQLRSLTSPLEQFSMS